MEAPVTWVREGPLGLVKIDNPPVNAAGLPVRAGLVAAIDTLEADPEVEVIVLYGAGRTFIAGADIREFGKPPIDPWLPAVCNRIEDCETPVVAILHGAALGGGLEVAMAAHARVALAGVKLGLPEVTLGILPGAGGTQRAPRLIGVSAALDLILSGAPITADRALALGLIDQIGTGRPIDAARKAGKAVQAGTLKTRRTGELSVTADPVAIAAKRSEIATKMQHVLAPTRCIDAVASSELPLVDGLARERALFNDCLNSPQRAGLVHAFFAERAVAKIPEKDADASQCDRVGIVGAGTMGRGIASACLVAGLHVVLVDPSEKARVEAKVAVADALRGAERRGKLADAEAADKLLAIGEGLNDLADVDLVIEAAPENFGLKLSILEELDSICAPETILASNTSYLDLNALAAATNRSDRVLGLHFFAPAHAMRLLEVVVGANTAPTTVATGFAFAKRLKKVAVRSGVCDGFIGNRILAATRRAADEMVLMGASPVEVDDALHSFGFAMGPYAAQDLSGLDIGAAGRAVRGESAPLADALIARGELGRKTGAGFYTDAARQVLNPALTDIIADARMGAGLSQNAPNAEEIITRYMAAMVAEGTRIVEEGIALRPIDVDVVLLFGYGFPRYRGGPMHYADLSGAAHLVNQIKSFAEINPNLWSVPDLLMRRAESGGKLVS
ncbi:MAG: 3-hydroxyacyl-CoA dehydrogenase NAD-binding domain-containing protein [Pseudomonadota bacterium]